MSEKDGINVVPTGADIRGLILENFSPNQVTPREELAGGFDYESGGVRGDNGGGVDSQAKSPPPGSFD